MVKGKQCEITDNQISISVEKNPLIIRIFLSVILIVIASMPLLALVLIILQGEGIKFGILFSFILCWGVGFYLLRIILWNSVGKEIMVLQPENIQYYVDYDWFKSAFKELDTKDLFIHIIDESDSGDKKARLKMVNAEDQIETILPVKIAEIREIEEFISLKYLQEII